MKKIAFILVLFSQTAFAQLKIGDVVPDLQFNLLNAPVKSTSLNQLKGKVVVIEFWATWCGGCIVAMPHLKELQKKFPDQLRILSVSDESEERIRKFLSKKPSIVWFASDTTQQVSNVFPYRLIPHTVVISPDGKLVANTSPEHVTESVIENLINRKPVSLPEKKDNTLTFQELIDGQFLASASVTDRFMIQPQIKGAPGFSTTYLDDSTFKGRRITAINCGLSTLYRLAYDNFPYSRTVDKIPASDKESYCLDLIVTNENELWPRLRKELSNNFNFQAETKTELKDVYILKVTDQKKLAAVPRNTSGIRTYYARHGEMDQQAGTLHDLANYLEAFGISSLPVVDETNVREKLDLKFSFQPEDPASLTKVLADMGLALEKAKRDIKILYIW